MQTHRSSLRKRRVKTARERLAVVIQDIAGGPVKGIYATFWAI
jgi:hypothetical protein